MNDPIVMTDMGIYLPVNDRGEPKYFQSLRSANPKNDKYRRIQGQRAHRLIVEKRTGIKLPATAVVHHCDPNDKRSNRGPFIVCQDGTYHQLIEARTRALKACGNANWKKCRKCGRYDDPANMQSKEYEGPFATQTKYWHYRFKNQCVDKDHPVKHTRPHVPRKRRHVAPWRENAAQIEQERLAAFKAFLATDSATLSSSDQDVCPCGERVAKMHTLSARYHCVGCGAQKRAGFVGRSRSAGTPNRSERPLNPLGSPKPFQERKSMWVYIQSEPTLWTVGFYAPNGKWHSDSDHTDRESAARRVAFLNGARELATA